MLYRPLGCIPAIRAAQLALSYDLPYPSVQAVNNCRNKFLSKTLWQAQDLHTPRARIILSETEAAHFFEEFGGLSAEIHEHLLPIVPCRICLEPGRWICNDAVQLLISVVDKKAADLVITDAGTNTIGWERFETDYCPILNLTRPSLNEQPCHILGSLCTPHDIWGYMYFGDDIRPGDILFIPAQGAYTYSLRQNFIKPLPAVVTI